MSARPVLMRPGNGRMVHLAGVLDSNTQEFLRPAVATIATAGMPQSVVHIRNDRDSPLVFPDSVDVLTVDRRDANRMRSWRSLLEVFLGVVGQGGVYAVHLHGFAAGLLGARALSNLGGGTRAFEEKELAWVISDLGLKDVAGADEKYFKLTITKVGLIESVN